MQPAKTTDIDADPSSQSQFDIIIIGGGIQGIMLAHEAARERKKPLLLERDRFCAGTTSGWFRILHGGLRYLQQFDTARVRESSRERQWFLDNYPQFVKPHPFLMPLYGRGLKRPSAFRAAFQMTELLTSPSGTSQQGTAKVPAGRVISREETMSLFPAVPITGLKGGALWYDCVNADTPALVRTLVADTRKLGAIMLEGTQVQELTTEDGHVTGVTATYGPASKSVTFSAPTVINAAGRANTKLAEKFHKPNPALFEPALAFNVLLDCPPPADCGLSVTPQGRNGPMLFLYPDQGRTFAGTWYVPQTTQNNGVAQADIEEFLQTLNACVPGLEATPGRIIEVSQGLLPVAKSGTTDLVQHEIIIDHRRTGGPKGLLSVTCVKFTTARSVAQKVLKLAARSHQTK